jgi:signal transduction histidine kinase
LHLELENIGDVVREATEFTRRDLQRKHVELELEIDEALPLLRVDEAQLKQAFFNLLRNASEAMPAGGTVRISAGRAAEGGVDIVVEDEGTGMDDATREHLFEPFFTTKSHGTGLGLPITREILEAHGGSIACEPRDPRGTRFRLHLPTDEVGRPGAAAEAPALSPLHEERY